MKNIFNLWKRNILTDLSVNYNSIQLVKELCNKANEYRVLVKENNLGTCVIDAGLEAEGGLFAGKIITEICLGGLGKVTINFMSLNDLQIPSIFVSTDHPAISTLGSQLAGWRVKIGDYSAVGSGPARALALKPRDIFKKISYKDKFNTTVLVLESSEKPSEEAIRYIASSCKVKTENLFLILVPTSSLSGFTQISGRIAEVGIHKLTELGLDPKAIIYACGSAPILPIHPDLTESMGRTNDAILYGGTAYYTVNYADDRFLKDLVKSSVSSSSKQYGRPFAEIFREANFDFYKIDPGIFAPASIMINNIKTGRTYSKGKVNFDIIRRALSL
jgi:methenyltetrahydromethanopterin cyclohydrolase